MLGGFITDFRPITRTLRALNLMKLEDTPDVGLTNFKTKMATDALGVLSGLRKIGRNPDSEAFLKNIKPNVGEDELKTIFGTSTVNGLGFGANPVSQPVKVNPLGVSDSVTSTEPVSIPKEKVNLNGLGFGANPQPATKPYVSSNDFVRDYAIKKLQGQGLTDAEKLVTDVAYRSSSPNYRTARAALNEGLGEYSKQYGGVQTARELASAVTSPVLPATSKALNPNPEKEAITPVDVLWDAAWVLPGLGYVTKAGNLIKDAAMAAKIVKAANVAGATSAAVASGTQTAENWDESTTGEKALGVGMTALAGAGGAYELKGLVPKSAQQAIGQTARELAAGEAGAIGKDVNKVEKAVPEAELLAKETAGKIEVPPAAEVKTALSETPKTSEIVPPVEPPKVPTTTASGELPSRKGFAANIKLSKFPAEVQGDIKAFADSQPDVIQAARRGTVSFEQTTANAEDLIAKTGGDPKKLIKRVGQAYNDSEIRAIGGALSDVSSQINDMRKVLASPEGTSLSNQVKLAELIEKHNYLQLAAHASRAEAGRALSSLRILQDALKTNSNPVMAKVLKQLGGKYNFEEISKAMQGLDWNNSQEVNAFIRSVVKPGLQDYVNEIFVNSILSGSKTHLVNGITNMVNTVMSPVERGVAAVIELGLAKVQGRQVERFLSEVPADIWGAMDGISEGTRASLQTIKTGISPAAASKYEYRPTVFKGKLGRVMNFPTNMLEAADNLNYNINYRSAFNAEALRAGRVQGLKGQALIDYLAEVKINSPASLVKSASETANYRLFRAEGNGIADVLYKFRNWGFEVPKVGKVQPLKFVLPFVRTPVNIAKYGLERSPLGFFNPSLIKNLAAKNPQAADQLARAFVGTSIMVTIAALFSKNKITGAAPTSKNARDRFYREGKQAYSIKIGDTWVSYQRLEPFNTDFTLVALAVDAINQKDTTADQKLMDAASAFGKNFVSQTYMSGISDIINAISEPETYGSNILQSTGQALLVPASSMTRTIAQAFDKTIRNPSNFIETVEAGIPGLSQNVPAKLNVFGEESKRQTPWYSPINISKEDNSQLNQELNKHDVNIGFVGDTISGLKLDSEQQQQYQKYAGRLVKQSILKLIGSDDYKGMSAIDAANAIQSVSDEAKKYARMQLLQNMMTDSVNNGTTLDFEKDANGKEQVPSDKTLWQPYLDYNSLPSGSYLNMTKYQVMAGELPPEYQREWTAYQKLTTDAAKTAYRKSHPEVAYSSWRDDIRRDNPDFDKWLQEQRGMKPLPPKAIKHASSGSIRLAFTGGSGFGGASPRKTSISYPKFKKPKISMAMKVSAPKV